MAFASLTANGVTATAYAKAQPGGSAWATVTYPPPAPMPAMENGSRDNGHNGFPAVAYDARPSTPERSSSPQDTASPRSRKPSERGNRRENVKNSLQELLSRVSPLLEKLDRLSDLLSRLLPERETPGRQDVDPDRDSERLAGKDTDRGVDGPIVIDLTKLASTLSEKATDKRSERS